MKLLLTSAGVKNPTIHAALLRLLGRPVEECTALAVPTGMYGHPMVGPGAGAWRFAAGRSQEPMVDLGWKSVGLLELTALPSLDESLWLPVLRAADVLLVSGGDALYLAHWMRESGVADLLPGLDAVYLGMSAGSMVLTPRIGADFVGWRPPDGGDDRTLGLVGFSLFPHVDHPDLPENTMAAAQEWAAGLGNPAYAIDDATAVLVDGDEVEIASEGTWRHFGS